MGPWTHRSSIHGSMVGQIDEGHRSGIEQLKFIIHEGVHAM
jgi:hypothetical protein